MEMCPNFTFSRNIFRFLSAKFLMTSSLVIDHKFLISPLFSLFHYIFPYLFRENYYSPYFYRFPPVFREFTCFLHTLCVFPFPPTLTMMHLCITQFTYWTPLITNICATLVRVS